MIEIRVASFGAKERTSKLFKELIRTWKTNDFSRILYITPTSKKLRFSIRKFEKLALERSPAIIPPDFFTLNTLASSYHFAGIPLADITKHIIIEKLMAKNPGTFGVPSTGLVNQVSKFIKEIKTYSPYRNSAQLKLDTKTIRNSSVQEKALKLINLYSAYSRLLKKAGLLDPEDIMKRAFLALRKSKDPCKKILILDSFYDITSVEEMLIRELIKKTEKTIALVWDGEEEIYSIPRIFKEKLETMEDYEIIKEPFKEDSPQIESFAYKTREEELEGIARKIKDLKCVHPEIPLNKIFVTFPAMENCSLYVARIFEKYGIQFSLSPGYTLQSAPPITAIISLLETIYREYPRDKFLGTLRSPYLKLISEEDFAHLSHISLKAGVVRGARSWEDGFNIYMHWLANKRSHKDSPRLSRKDIESIKLKIKKIFKKLGHFRTRHSLAEFVSLLKELLDWMGIRERIKEEKGELGDRDDKALKSFLCLLDEILTAEKVWPGKKGKISLEKFIKILKMSAANSEYIRKGKEFEGVQILGYLETRGLDPEVLFFGGLTDEDLPGTHYQDILLPDSLRQRWSLPTPENIVERKKLHYQRLIKSAKRKVFLSYPLTVDEALVAPTPFMDDKFKVRKPEKFAKNIIYGEEDGERLKKSAPRLRKAVSFPDSSSTERTLSIHVTDLEKFARCPFQYYVEKTLGIEPVEEPTEYMSGVDYGRIVHDIMKVLYERIKSHPAHFEKSFEYALESVLKNLRLGEFWQEVIRDRLNLMRDDLLHCDEELKRDGFRPTYMELSQRISFKSSGQKIILKGRLDRVDISERGFVVIDYKTGKAPTKADLEKGLHLQIPIYAWMLKKHLRIPPSGGLIYTLDMEKGFRRVTLFNREDADQVISRSVRFVKQYSSMLKEGKFPKNEKPKNCRNCNCKFVCENFEG
ncbi:Dna2/Cas4 domain-containing protein [Candidatus Aerophobetes bacterium]|uniref:Dna2/Cas4 domain-containing protein n=1 Tax=Aerophobetes bacterium TaxID=2030807 RepID=A0A523TE84_UNCAE|nr:MAG: Dna2/Cas4 domain-containing protein [Candidatus Aerophobetes bacterium]